VELKSIGHIIQADGMSQLGEQQRDDMAPVAKVTRFPIRAGLPGELGDQVPRNEIANLLEDLVHPPRVRGRGDSRDAHLAGGHSHERQHVIGDQL
jgi:hypothetical protein